MGGVADTISSITQPIAQGIGQITGANKVGDIYGQIGSAQLAQQEKDRQQALGYAVNDQQMQQLQQAITLNNQDIARKQSLLASADPALIAAGQQALSLMQGQSAPSLKPLQDQRAQQRQQLQTSLAQQLGPDYATSSQGMAALNQFDQQTSNILTQAQQSAIGQYMGYAGAAEQFGNLGQNMGQQMNIAGQYGNVANRQIGAIEGSTVNPGLQYQGQLANASAQNQTLNQLLGGLGANAIGKGFSNGGFGNGMSNLFGGAGSSGDVAAMGGASGGAGSSLASVLAAG